MTPVMLRTERLSLSMPNAEDIPQLVAACNAPEIARVINHLSPYTASDAEEFLTHVDQGWKDNSCYVWAVRQQGVLVGQLSLDKKGQADTAVIGYWLAAEARRKGYLMEAAHEVLAWALDPRRGNLQKVLWHAYTTNARSIRIAQQLGFQLQGTKERGELTWNSLGAAFYAQLSQGDQRIMQDWIPLRHIVD